MSIRIKDDNLLLKNRHAWVEWGFAILFLIMLPVTNYAMWVHGEDIPLWFSLPYSAVSGLAFFGLLKMLRGKHSVTAVFDRTARKVYVRAFDGWRITGSVRGIEEAERLETRVTDNDGQFYSVVLCFPDGFELPVTQGSHKAGVEAESQRFLAFLTPVHPGLQVTTTP